MQMNLTSAFWNFLSVPENEKKIQIAAKDKKFEKLDKQNKISTQILFCFFSMLYSSKLNHENDQEQSNFFWSYHFRSCTCK